MPSEKEMKIVSDGFREFSEMSLCLDFSEVSPKVEIELVAALQKC